MPTEDEVSYKAGRTLMEEETRCQKSQSADPAMLQAQQEVRHLEDVNRKLLDKIKNLEVQQQFLWSQVTKEKEEKIAFRNQVILLQQERMFSTRESDVRKQVEVLRLKHKREWTALWGSYTKIQTKPGTKGDKEMSTLEKGQRTEWTREAKWLEVEADPCPHCQERHLIIHCPDMLRWTGLEMMDAILSWKRCTRCLRPEHGSADDCKGLPCRHCKGPHNSRCCLRNSSDVESQSEETEVA